MSAKRYTLLFGFLLVASICFGQRESLNALVERFNNYRNTTLVEKLFVHTDRTMYLTGETIWLKLYYVDGSFHKPLNVSKVAYIEVLDNENKAVLQAKVSLADGSGIGSFFLPASLSSGQYLVRAYTQWMRNFSPDLFFQQPMTVVNPFTKLGLKPRVEKPEYDIQFFPEGGYLVNGVTSKVAFRVVDKKGKGIDFHGAIVDQSNDTVARFKPLKFGIGNFTFRPVLNHTYKAIIADSKRNRITTSVPVAKDGGYVMRVTDTTDNRLSVAVFAAGNVGSIPLVYLLAHTRNKVAATDAKVLEQGKTTFLVDKKNLGEGVSHLTIFNDASLPVCERLYFKQPSDELEIDIATNKQVFSTREKIDVDFYAHTSDGAPREANFSVAVMKSDSLTTPEPTDIFAYLWLTSELKGSIESADYYVRTREPEALEAADNLMLTHGWSRFKWENILKKTDTAQTFIPEYRGHLLKARVINTLTGQPARGISTTLATPGRNVQLYLSRSDADGLVQYELRDYYGIRKVVAQTNSLVDSTYRIEITSPYAATFSSYRLPEFDLPETLKNPIARRSLNMQVHNIFLEEHVRAIDPEIDSLSFYGKPDEKYMLDEFTRFPTMEEVMREYVPGVMVRKHKDRFRFLTLDHDNNTLFRDNPLVLLDGVIVYDINKIMAYDPRKVQRLDVMTHKYFIGHLSFEGLVSYTTYHGDLLDFELDPGGLSANYEGLQVEREFFSPRYENQEQRESRIPDTRDLLYWAPDVITDLSGKTKLGFYSSDVSGNFVIFIQGITRDGKPGSSSIMVKVNGRESY